MQKIKLMIVDDHPPFVEGLCLLLEREKDLEVIAKPADGVEAVKLAKKLLPDVAVIDVAMPRLSGIEVAKQIKSACPAIAILMLSAYTVEAYLIASLQAGASGYLLKTSSVNEIIRGIHSVFDGQAIFDLKSVKKVLRGISTDLNTNHSSKVDLHNRELEILKMAAEGTSNKEIAKQLNISTRTVQTHLLRVYRKLGVNSRTEAAMRAVKEGWLILDDLS